MASRCRFHTPRQVRSRASADAYGVTTDLAQSSFDRRGKRDTGIEMDIDVL